MPEYIPVLHKESSLGGIRRQAMGVNVVRRSNRTLGWGRGRLLRYLNAEIRELELRIPQFTGRPSTK